MDLGRLIPKTWLGPRRNQATPGNHRHIIGTIREGYISEPLFYGQNPQSDIELIAVLEEYGLDGSGYVPSGGGGGGATTIYHHNEVLKASGVAPDTEYTLTYLASDEHWPHIVCSGVPQRDTYDYDYDFDTGIVTIDSNMELETDDILWVRYDHYNEESPVPPGPDPDVITLFDSHFDGLEQTAWALSWTAVEEDDLILVFANVGNSRTAATPSGYTLIHSTTIYDANIYIWKKLATGGETGVSGSVSGSETSVRRVFAGLVLRGAVPIDVIAIEDGGLLAGSTSPIPQITNMGEGEYAVLNVMQTNGVVSGSASASPSPWTNELSETGYSGKHSIRLAYHETAADGDDSPNGTQGHLGSVNGHRNIVLRVGS